MASIFDANVSASFLSASVCTSVCTRHLTLPQVWRLYLTYNIKDKGWFVNYYVASVCFYLFVDVVAWLLFFPSLMSQEIIPGYLDETVQKVTIDPIYVLLKLKSPRYIWHRSFQLQTSFKTYWRKDFQTPVSHARRLQWMLPLMSMISILTSKYKYRFSR